MNSEKLKVKKKARNEGRPGYKKTKIGWIPEEWECVRLKEVSDINPEALSDKTDQNYMFHYIDLSTANEGKLNLPSNKIAFREAPSRARRKVKKNDVLLATVRPNLKGFAYISFEANDIVCSTGYAVLRSKNEVISLYLFYNLFSHETERYFYSCVVGSNYPALNNSDVNNLRIPLPPLSEQKKIAEILSAWDRTIEITNRLITNYELLKKGLMQQLLTGRMRFPEFNHETHEIREKKKGQLLVGWKEIKIKEIAHEVSDRNTNKIKYPVLSCSKYDGFVNSLEYFGKKIFSDDTSNYKIIKRGQFGFPSNHIEEGSIGLLNHVDAGIVSPIYAIFETNPEKVFAPYLYTLFKTDTYQHVFRVNTSSSVDRRGSLRWKAFSNIRVPLPSLSEQRRIATVLSTCDREIELLKKKREKLKEQKKGLMQRLLTGEIRHPEFLKRERNG